MYRPSRSVCQHTLVPLSILPSLCFKFKSDAIKASWDYTLNPVRVLPPAVPKHRMGNCYAKRYLIAALLRANGFPAELYYQRLIIENQKPPFRLHGHHAIYLDKCGWYRVDARRNTALGERGSPIICIPQSSFLPDALENSMTPRSLQLPMNLKPDHLNVCAILS